jgi:hypothetical protein
LGCVTNKCCFAGGIRRSGGINARFDWDLVVAFIAWDGRGHARRRNIQHHCGLVLFLWLA